MDRRFHAGEYPVRVPEKFPGCASCVCQCEVLTYRGGSYIDLGGDRRLQGKFERLIFFIDIISWFDILASPKQS